MLLPPATSKTNLINPMLVWFRSSRRCLLWFCFALLTVSTLHPAIFQAQEAATDDEVVKVNTNLLVFPIRVRDRRGPVATTLTERDLLLKDEDRVTAGLYWYAGVDRVALVFALDQSGSLRETITSQREAALALFGRFS